ncbi:MAG TPA: Fur family transcriptional regulator [Anaerolineae bacterium]|nr:Fur family transcriptional regulator [Anaerolineae bacterium]
MGHRMERRRVMSHHMETAEELRARGYRLTPQRLLVLEAIKGAGHLTAEQVLERVQPEYAMINAATIYRTLEWLKQTGLVAETDLGDGCRVYEFIAGHPHHHLTCLTCGRQIELPDELLDALRARIEREYGFALRADHMGLFGYCPECRERETPYRSPREGE